MYVKCVVKNCLMLSNKTQSACISSQEAPLHNYSQLLKICTFEVKIVADWLLAQVARGPLVLTAS